MKLSRHRQAKKHLRQDSGAALATVLLLLVVLALVGGAMFARNAGDLTISSLFRQQTAAKYAAESGLNRALAKLRIKYDDPNKIGLRSDIAANELPVGDHEQYQFSTPNASTRVHTFEYEDKPSGAKVTYKIVDDSGWALSPTQVAKELKIYATAHDPKKNTIQSIEQHLWVTRTPVSSYAFFFDQDLDLFPGGADMLITGDVHTNGNLFMLGKGMTNPVLYIDGMVSAAGHVQMCRKTQSECVGQVEIKNPSTGLFVAMNSAADQNGSAVQDGNAVNDAIAPIAGTGFRSFDIDDPLKEGVTWNVDPNWLTSSKKWNGAIGDKSHGVEKVLAPAVDSIQPTGAYANAAGLKIVTNAAGTDVALIHNGVTKTASDCGLTLGTDIEPSKAFYDRREKMVVKNTVINVASLETSSCYPANGLIYATREDAVPDPNPEDGVPDSSRKPNGFKLENGSTLDQPMTFVTNNPLYVKGDFNVDLPASSPNPWKPAALIGDVVTILSNAWNDSAAQSSADMPSPATNTEVNAILVSGHRPTREVLQADNTLKITPGGGAENFVRHLELWSDDQNPASNQKLKIQGSFIQLWETEFATSNYGCYGIDPAKCPSGYYTAPVRNYSYDKRFSDLTQLPGVMLDSLPAATTRFEYRTGRKAMDIAATPF